MPPNLDIYALTKHRDLKTINRFIDRYADRAANEGRGDEDIMILNPSDPFEVNWEPALTLSHMIERGLDYPRICFTIYLGAIVERELGSLIHFTADNQLVLGLSIDDEGALPENEERAKSLLRTLVEEFDCHMGLIKVEDPPPTSEAEFIAAVKKPLFVYFYQRVSKVEE